MPQSYKFGYKVNSYLKGILSLSPDPKIDVPKIIHLANLQYIKIPRDL